MKSGSKVFGIGDAAYTTSRQDYRGVSLAERKKIDVEKVRLIRTWKKNLTRVLRVGTGLDIHLDTAMRELVEDLQKWDEEITR